MRNWSTSASLAAVLTAIVAGPACIDIAGAPRYTEREEKRFTVGDKPELTAVGDAPDLTYAWYSSVGKLEHSRSAKAVLDATTTADGMIVLVVRDGEGRDLTSFDVDLSTMR